MAEALAAGVPVVVTEHAGAAELAREGANGWVIPAGAAGTLAERLRAVRSRPPASPGDRGQR